MNKSNVEVRQFIDNCRSKYSGQIDPEINVMEFMVKDHKFDIKNVKGFTWKKMSQSWGMAEADLLKTLKKETGSLRVLWYRSFKQYAMNVMRNDLNLDKANALLSQGLADLVRTGEYMYEDFCVEDFAYAKDFSEFIKSLNVILFVEKASEFPKFQKSCEILGIKVLLQGSGRPNFSSTEYIFTNFFKNRVDKDHPIRILTLTDFDYDGVNPIANGFVKQMLHYTPYVRVGRVGLERDQIPENQRSIDGSLYEVRQDNKNEPKKEWMEKNLFKDKNGRFLGAEVESHPFKFYYPLVWDALKQTGVTYQDFVDQQYINIQPDIKGATRDIAIKLLDGNGDFDDINQQISDLNIKRSQIINDKMEEIKPDALKIKNDNDFIYFQVAKGEASIREALRLQKKWSGNLQYAKQTNEFKRRLVGALK